MKRNVKNNTKINNKGFTLVEVIIAMTVLVIVSIPMLDTLSGTTTVTVKSSNRQRATLLAQSISEGVKRYSTKDLCEAFVKPGLTKTADDIVNFPVLDSKSFTFSDFSRLEESGGGYKKIRKQSENSKEYFFGIFGIETGVSKYDALIKLDSELYEDVNAEVIPEIVNIGAPGTGLIDISGLYNGIDILKDVEDQVVSDTNPLKEAFDPKKITVKVEVVIKKNHTDQYGNPNVSYEIYGNVIYEYKYASKTVQYKYNYLGSRTLDSKQKLNYVYVLLNDDKLKGTNVNTLKFSIDVDSSENIPIAIVTGESKAKWEMSVADIPATPVVNKWRDAVTFFTNATTSKLNYRNKSVVLSDYATSGNKLKRIYKLEVELYGHHSSMTERFKSEPIDKITSSYLRIDVNEFNDDGSRDE